MSVLIEGMEMPDDENDSIHILRDGTAVVYRTDSIDFYKAVPVSPHGRLIDADKLTDNKDLIHKSMVFGGQVVYSQGAIDHAPTIIEAEEGE